MTFQDELPVLYITSGCAQCRAAAAFLQENGIAHREKNISEDRAAMAELRRLTADAATPTLVWQGDLLTDFNVEQLVDFLHARSVELEDS